VVAEFVAGTGGNSTGLAYQILFMAGYQLNIPRMFAALLLISLTGVALFVLMAWLSKLALGSWHASELSQAIESFHERSPSTPSNNCTSRCPTWTGSPTARASRACRRTSPGSARCSSASWPARAPTPSCGRAAKTRSSAWWSLCAKLRIPITIRGSGTGNYGQSVPLHGGVVLDMSGFNQFLWARNGVARAQAGIRLIELEKETRAACNMELRCMPSTYRSATLGGLFGGGFGGIGSINYGPLAAGNVLGIKAITIEEEPQLVELRGPEAMLMHHLWGTNGLVLEIELALAPAYDWQEHFVVFLARRRAGVRQQAIAAAPGIVKREVGLLARRPGLPEAAGRGPAGRLPRDDPGHRAGQRSPVRELATPWRGEVTYSKSAER
jgi:hypothetical protein